MCERNSVSKKNKRYSDSQIKKRDKDPYPALNPGLNLKTRHEEIEIDYLHKLSPEEAKWLNKFNEEYSKLVKNIPDDWDYIYFGKKQGKESALPKNMTHIYPSNIININKINDFVYKPNYFTYATHSICIKNTIYDVLIERYNTLCAPVDLIVMSLYEK